MCGFHLGQLWERIMAKRPYEKLVLFGVSTCGLGGNDLGGDEKEICLLSWQVIDTTKIQV